MEWDSASSPGCSLAVSRNGDLLYERGYGSANLELGVPITPASVFDVASVAKAFTAMSVLLLAEEGRLSLDDDVRRHVPEWADPESGVTIRHLLAHTSGLREAFGLLGWAGPAERSVDLRSLDHHPRSARSPAAVVRCRCNPGRRRSGEDRVRRQEEGKGRA